MGKFIQYGKGGGGVGWRYWGGLQNLLDTHKGGSEKIRVGGAQKFMMLQNQQEGEGS